MLIHGRFVLQNKLKSSLLNRLRPSTIPDQMRLQRALQPQLSSKRQRKELLRRSLVQRYVPPTFVAQGKGENRSSQHDLESETNRLMIQCVADLFCALSSLF